jgi:hypothetical protein
MERATQNSYPFIRLVEYGYDARIVAKLSIIFSHEIDLVPPGST